MSDLLEIDKLAKKFSDAHEELGKAVRDLNETIEIVRREHMTTIKRAFSQAVAHKDNLRAAIEGSPELFEKPRTLVMHGVKIGFAKGKGAIEIEDVEKTVELIEKRLPDLVDVLIKTKKTPIKDALNGLSAEDLRKIGVSVEEAGDYVVIKPVDGEVDKIIKALFKEADKEFEAAAA